MVVKKAAAPRATVSTNGQLEADRNRVVAAWDVAKSLEDRLDGIERKLDALAPSVVTDGWVLGPETIGVLRQLGNQLMVITGQLHQILGGDQLVADDPNVEPTVITVPGLLPPMAAQVDLLFEAFRKYQPVLAAGKFVNMFSRKAPHGPASKA